MLHLFLYVLPRILHLSLVQRYVVNVHKSKFSWPITTISVKIATPTCCSNTSNNPNAVEQRIKRTARAISSCGTNQNTIDIQLHNRLGIRDNRIPPNSVCDRERSHKHRASGAKIEPAVISYQKFEVIAVHIVGAASPIIRTSLQTNNGQTTGNSSRKPNADTESSIGT